MTGLIVEGNNLTSEISQDTPTQNQGADQPQPQKLLTQEQVNKLVGSTRQDAHERGRQEAFAEMSSKMSPIIPQSVAPTAQSMSGQMYQPSQAAPQVSGPAGVDTDALRKITQEEIAKQAQEWQKKAQEEAANQQAARIINEVNAKVTDAKTRYPDFDKVVDMRLFQQMPDVLHLASTVDNSGDVIYDLFKNPGKFAQLRAVPPVLAQMQVRQLSDSIKQNQLASSTPVTPEPLSQIKPSTIGLDNGSKRNASISDLRNDPSYRG